SDDETYKPDMVVYGEHYSAVTDALGICKFITIEEYSLFPSDLLESLRALGISLGEQELLEIGERIVNLERLYNVRLGFNRQDDYLPRRFTEEPIDLYATVTAPDGSTHLSSEVIKHGAILRLEPMLDRYYALRGWTNDGLPPLQTLERLGLSQYAPPQVLERASRH
ncbi:MAG: hypothetical protein HY335_08600, partial [Deinococcus sp.]|nr:hypothetical protein [Deinococcus sp.]